MDLALYWRQSSKRICRYVCHVPDAAECWAEKWSQVQGDRGEPASPRGAFKENEPDSSHWEVRVRMLQPEKNSSSPRQECDWHVESLIRTLTRLKQVGKQDRSRSWRRLAAELRPSSFCRAGGTLLWSRDGAPEGFTEGSLGFTGVCSGSGEKSLRGAGGRDKQAGEEATRRGLSRLQPSSDSKTTGFMMMWSSIRRRVDTWSTKGSGQSHWLGGRSHCLEGARSWRWRREDACHTGGSRAHVSENASMQTPLPINCAILGCYLTFLQELLPIKWE